MNIYYSDLRKLELEEKKLKDAGRKKLGSKPHSLDGNFVACFGNQIDPNDEILKLAKPLFGGLYVKYNDIELLVDPGANIIERSKKLGVNLSRTNTLFISHAHIDHCHDADIVMEILALNKQSNLPVSILLSKKSLSEHAIHPYHLKRNPDRFKLTLLDEHVVIQIGKNIKLEPIEVVHSIKGSYGFVLTVGTLKIGYTGDSGFSKTFKTATGEYPVGEENVQEEILGPSSFNKTLKSIFSNVDILIFNLHSVSYKNNSLYHSNVFDLIEVLKKSNVQICICDHFEPETLVGADYPKKVIDFIKQETGKDVRLVGQMGLITSL